MENRDILQSRTYRFSLNVIRETDKLPNKRSAWIITDQLIRAACSIGANHAEARASSSRLEYKKFFEIALKSANETVYWLNLLKDSGLAKIEDVNILLKEAIELSRMLGKSVLTLKAKKF